MNSCFFANYSIGKDAYKYIQGICAPLGKRVLILGGETALSVSEKKLKDNMTDFVIVDTVIYGKECYKKRIAEISDNYKDKEIDFVMGVGGGKAIDTSKCVADTLKVPVVTIPTICSTCAASSALAVIYNEEHAYEGFWYLKSPAYHVFIDTDIIINAPEMYIRAGIGDTFAKYYEVEFSARNSPKSYKDEMGISISRMCNSPLIENALSALEDAKNKKATDSFEQVALIILVSTGMVSMLINPEFNGALAHALFYGLTVIPGFEEKFLHGDCIGYTTTIQLLLDGKDDEAEKISELIGKMGVERTLSARGIDTSYEFLEPVLLSTLKDPDMKLVPYEVTKEMIYDAIIKAERKFGGNI